MALPFHAVSVYAISDLHGFLPDPGEIPCCELLLIAGDVCPDFHEMSFARFGGSRKQPILDKGEQKQRHWLDTTFREWLEEVNHRVGQVIGIAGNHDFVFEHPFLLPDLPWIYLRDSEVEIVGLHIWGTPWVPNLARWAFYGKDSFLEARAECIPDYIDVLITHGPPYGVCDVVAEKFGGPANVGDRALLQRIEEIEPLAVVCGHIHEAFGLAYTAKGVPVYNVSRCDENYDESNLRRGQYIWEAGAMATRLTGNGSEDRRENEGGSA